MIPVWRIKLEGLCRRFWLWRAERIVAKAKALMAHAERIRDRWTR